MIASIQNSFREVMSAITKILYQTSRIVTTNNFQLSIKVVGFFCAIFKEVIRVIVTDYNLMSVEELQIISERTGIEFQINDGKIVNAERSAK